MQVIQYGPQQQYYAPIYGAAADIVRGAMLMRGATPGTNNGALIVATGAGADTIGILRELLDFSVDGETLIAGTAFVVKPVDYIAPFRVVRIQYDQTDIMDATQAVSTTTITLASLEDNIDAAFLYVTAGVGAGQTNFLTASAAGSATLKAAFTTDLDTSSDLIKILPRFHQTALFNAAGTQLGTAAAVGTWTVIVLENYIQKQGGGRLERLDPTVHDALTGLDGLTSLKFWADVAVRNTVPASVD